MLPREARRESATQYYHVMQRGVNREAIFLHDKDKRIYLDLLVEQKEAERIEIVAWCLMDNHVHIVLQANITELAEALKSIGIKYANYYNKTQNRIGPTFNERYKSVVIEDDVYFLSAVRYVHNNPVKGGVVETVAEYNWSSYKEYLHNSIVISENQKSILLKYFGGCIDDYLRFHLASDAFNHLEGREESLEYRLARGRQVLNKFYEQHQITGPKVFRYKRLLLWEVSAVLVNTIGLSANEAGELLGVSTRQVQRSIKRFVNYNT